MLKKLFLAALAVIISGAMIPLCVAPAAAEEQIIAPGDILSITVLGEPDLTKRVIVDSQGVITLPLANEVEMAGATTSEAAARLKEKLTKYIKNPQVTVEIAQPARRQVVISGAVRTPGVYEIGSDGKLMTALTLAGGHTADADISKISITRGIRRDMVLSVDLNEFLAGGNPEANITLQPNDVIVVPLTNPTTGNVYLLGEVRQRGAYPIRQGMTLREAIAAAGGVTELADTEKVSVKHKDDTTGTSVDYSRAIAGDPAEDILLQAGDTIFVPAIETHGSFTILGPVARPGQYPVTSNMTITDALAAAGGTTAGSNMNSVRIARSGEQAQALNVNVSDIMSGKTQNVAVQPGDTIFVGERKAPTDKMRLAGLALSLLYFLMR